MDSVRLLGNNVSISASILTSARAGLGLGASLSDPGHPTQLYIPF